MIQRIQTVFLFLAVAGLMVQALFPVLSATPSTAEGLYQDGLLFIRENTVAFSLLILTGVLALVAIFLFKNLKLQQQIILSAIALLLVSSIVSAMVFSDTTRSISSTQVAVSPQPGLFMPLSCLILLILAFRYVKKDQRIIKSMDRLR
jgi:hypothetical protein